MSASAMTDFSHGNARRTRTIISICLGLSVLGACEGVQIGPDALVQHLPRGQVEVCRTAVRDALAEKNVTQDWIRRVHYQAVHTRNRVSGFQAWVYPKEGGGALVVELSKQCRVRRIWASGLR
jgi:hypothetical protein